MDLRLDNKAILAASALSGLGLVMALELTAECVPVVIGARDRGRRAASGRGVSALARGGVTATSAGFTDQAVARRWRGKVAERFATLLRIVAVSVTGGAFTCRTAGQRAWASGDAIHGRAKDAYT